jgi:hypothetical protein
MRAVFTYIFLLYLLALPSKAQTFYMDTVVTFSQGLTNNGNSVLPSRSNPTAALGVPQMSDVETGVINFFALGFGGSITLKTATPIPVTPLTQLQIFETTWSYNCAFYPEKATILVSKNGAQYELLGETCGNDNTIFSLYQKIDTISYIKIQDISDVSKFTSFVDADAYDVDGIQIQNLVPLSIELDFFEAELIEDKLYINFRTLSESGTLRFQIQSSVDAFNYEDLEIYFIGANYSTGPREYSGSIEYVAENTVEYVRLKEIDINGNEFYYDAVPIVKRYKILNGTFYDLLGRKTGEGKFLIKY